MTALRLWRQVELRSHGTDRGREELGVGERDEGEERACGGKDWGAKGEVVLPRRWQKVSNVCLCDVVFPPVFLCIVCVQRWCTCL